MFTKFYSALLLAVEAMAANENCCYVFQEWTFSGDYVTLCYASKDEPSTFYLPDYGIDRVGSYYCKSGTAYSFCDSSGSPCISGAGTIY